MTNKQAPDDSGDSAGCYWEPGDEGVRAMDCQGPLPKDDPRMVAWREYQASGDYKNTRNWALHDKHVDGSLWAAFERGWSLAAALTELPRLQSDNARLRELVQTLLDNDPDEPIADNGMTVLDAWRERAALTLSEGDGE